jgi:hypothetical protein
MAGKPLTSVQMLPFVFPRAKRFDEKHFRSLRRGAVRFARLVGRRGRQPIWALKAEDLIRRTRLK